MGHDLVALYSSTGRSSISIVEEEVVVVEKEEEVVYSNIAVQVVV